MDDNNHVHIYLDNNNRDKVFDKTTSSHERYIILMNDELQAENRQLHKTISTLNFEKQQLESDNERFDEAKRYSNGLLKNVAELNKLYIKLNILQKTQMQKIEEFNHSLMKQINELNLCFSILICLYLILLFIPILRFLMIPIMIIIFCLSRSRVKAGSEKYKRLILESDNKIKDINKDITEITQSQDHLSELIDTI